MSRPPRHGEQIIETSESRLKRALEEKREEKQWASRCGPVEVAYLPCPSCGSPHDRRDPCPPVIEALLGQAE
jgi:hypothetical protein